MKSLFLFVFFLFSCTFYSQEKVYAPEEVDQFPVINENPCTNDLSKRDCFQLQLMEFVHGKISYPENALKNGIEGVVYMQFEIDKNGIINNIKARSVREDFKNEAIRALSLLPKIEPAVKNGTPVPFIFGFPVNFAIQKSDGPKIDYFPQEQLIHPNVMEHQNHNEYLYNALQNKVVSILAQKRNLYLIKKNIKDTLSIAILFEVDKNGEVKKNKGRISINSRALYEKFGPDLEQIPSSLPQFKVLNKKPDPIVSTHHLFYQFLPMGQKEVELIHIPNTEKYKGGIVEEIPVFPGCKNLTQEEAKRCFQLKMQEHIKNHFSYPVEAQVNGISGKVYIIFIITKTGEIEKIRTRGPHKVLEKEAVRIIQLLPKMTPGKQNGKPIDVPYSIPITFKM
ncbi:energy transducer TonB [Muricauda sp. CAU 1633]|uniref:energy transducer TonB n=1 Tax=Allomuricauda sp. CAU 1633 TaxID=2816036 RepID=UPI001A8FA94C|nr:energy transducer TonB [Muricauda sp. CAU 1633]MBO0322766.1 energy transducer TonB [Muricauda sp. CAU 1633]